MIDRISINRALRGVQTLFTKFVDKWVGIFHLFISKFTRGDKPKKMDDQQSCDDNIAQENLDFIHDVLEKQYRNYSWNDGKVHALVTTNSILVAGIFVTLQARLVKSSLGTPEVLLLFSLLFVSISLIYCLRHSIPILSSGKSGPSDNLRAQTGITAMKNAHEYEQNVRSLSRDEMFHLASRQTYGMAWNNRRSHKIIQNAALLTMASSICIAVSVASIVLFEFKGLKVVSSPSESMPSEVRPSKAKPSEVKPSKVKPSEVKPSEVKPSEVKQV
jgi:hypothetical protein